jgi:hypothetical protein
MRRLRHSAHPVFDFLCGRRRPLDGRSGVVMNDRLLGEMGMCKEATEKRSGRIVAR